MTITPTVLANAVVDAAQTAYSYTLTRAPASGTTVYAAYMARFSTTVSEPSTPTVSGGMSSWTHISAVDAYYDASGTTSKLFLFEGTGTPDSGPVVFTHGASHASAGAVIVEMDGDAGTVQIVRSATSGTTDDSVTARTATLAATPAGSVFTVGSTNSSGAGPAPEAGYTSLATANTGGGYNSTLALFWDLAGADDTPNWTWGGPNKGGIYVVELEEAGGGTPQNVYVAAIDENTGGWVDQAGGTLDAAELADGSDGTPDDATYGRSPNSPTTADTVVVEAEAGTDPADHTGHQYTVRARAEVVSGAPTLHCRVEWVTGAAGSYTVIDDAGETQLTTSWQDLTFTLSEGEAANIPASGEGGYSGGVKCRITPRQA